MSAGLMKQPTGGRKRCLINDVWEGRRHMRSPILLAVSVLALCAYPTTSRAGPHLWEPGPTSYTCACVKSDVSHAYAAAAAVFAGEATEVIEPRTTDRNAPLSERLYTVKFKVAQAWKGVGFLDVLLAEVTVLSDQGRGACFSWGTFVKGGQYLVYARKTRTGQLATMFSCNRTAALEDASDDIKQLRRIQSPFFRFDPQHTPRSQTF